MTRTQSISDGGWGWFVLLGAFAGQMIATGTGLTLGPYIVEWQEYFSVGIAPVSIIVTEVAVCMQFTGIFSGALCKRFGFRRVMMISGLIQTVATISASFSSKLWHLYIFGAISGICIGLSYLPSVVIVGFYFKERLGLANGIASTGVGVGLLVMAPLIESLCDSYGWKGALLIHAAINANTIACGALFRPTHIKMNISKKDRIQSKSLTTLEPREQKYTACLGNHTIWSFCAKKLREFDDMFSLSTLIKNPRFATFLVVSMLTFCGHVSTLNFLPSKLVQELGSSKKTASLAISVYGICLLASRLVYGLLIDYKIITTVNLFLLSVVSFGSSALLNPLVTSVPGQFVLACVFGLASGVMISMTLPICRLYVPLDLTPNAVGLVLAAGGIGVLTGTQLMGQLAEVKGSYDLPFYIIGAGLWCVALVMAVSNWWSKKHDGVEEDDSAEENI